MLGLLMRLYRASPLHPRLGAGLARLLGLATRHLPSPRIRRIDGIRWELDLREVIDASLFFSGSFEPRAERIMARHLAPGMTAIDVGANIGYHTLRMARSVGPEGQVVAIEPGPRAVSRLRRNLALNTFSNVDVVVAALGDHDAELVELHVQSSYPLSGSSGTERALVRVARLDGLVLERELRRVDLIKIDVDGQEAKVLRGAVETLERFHPVLFFELTPSVVEARGDSVAELFASLVSLGYSISDESGTPQQDPVGQARRLPRGAGCNLLALPSAPPRPGR
jgi:FkbM family methyltransferase